MDLSKIISKCLILLMIIFIISCETKEQGKFKVSEIENIKESYYKAKSVLDSAVVAMGGQANLDSVTMISASYTGNVFSMFQGPDMDSLHRSLNRKGSFVINLENDNYFSKSKTYWPNFTSDFQILKTNDKVYSIDDGNQTFAVSPSSPVPDVWMRRITPYLIKKLKASGGNLRYLGRIKENNKNYEVISSIVSNQSLTLYFDAERYFLNKLEFLDYAPDLGDSMNQVVFDEYIDLNGLMVASKILRYEEDYLILEYFFSDFKINKNVDLSKLKLPDYKEEELLQTLPPEIEVEQLSSNIYLVKNLLGRDYNSAFVDLGNYLVALETPLNDRASTQAIAEIRKIFPNKPIKYAIITHFHGDHSGGFKEYVREGATIIAPEDTKSYFEVITQSKHSLQGETYQGNLNPEYIFVGEEGYELAENGLELRIVDIGPSSHVKNILVTYIPEKNFLFQGDLFRMPEQINLSEPIRPESIEFYKKMQEKEWDVEILAGAHGPVGSFKDLERRVKVQDSI